MTNGGGNKTHGSKGTEKPIPATDAAKSQDAEPAKK